MFPLYFPLLFIGDRWRARSGLSVYLHATVHAVDRGDLVAAVCPYASTQPTDNGLVLLTIQTQGVVVLRAALRLGRPCPAHLPQGVHDPGQADVGRGVVPVHGTAAHWALQLSSGVHGHGAHTDPAVGVAALQHQGLCEHLQTHRAFELFLQGLSARHVHPDMLRKETRKYRSISTPECQNIQGFEGEKTRVDLRFRVSDWPQIQQQKASPQQDCED